MITLADKIYACYSSGVPCLIWGQPGIGKSASIEYLAKKLNLHLETIIASCKEPSDFSGMPIRDDELGVKFIPPRWAKSFENLGVDKGMVFFDELSTCSPNIYAPLLNIILTGWVGEYKMPDGVYRISASNFTDVIGNNEISQAMTNRFINIHHKCDSSLFCNLLSNDFNYDLAEVCNNREISSYPNLLNKYRKLIAKFLEDNAGKYTYLYPENIENPLDYAYPTPRSWTNVATVLASLEGTDVSITQELIVGCVGVKVGNTFWKFIKNNIKRKYRFIDHTEDYQSEFDPVKLKINVDECDMILNEVYQYYKMNSALNGNDSKLDDIVEFHLGKIKEMGFAGLVATWKMKFDAYKMSLYSNGDRTYCEDEVIRSIERLSNNESDELYKVASPKNIEDKQKMIDNMFK